MCLLLCMVGAVDTIVSVPLLPWAGFCTNVSQNSPTFGQLLREMAVAQFAEALLVRQWHSMQANLLISNYFKYSAAAVRVDCDCIRNLYSVGEMANQFKVCHDSTQRVHVWVTASLKLYAPKVWCIKFQVCGSPHVRVVLV